MNTFLKLHGWNRKKFLPKPESGIAYSFQFECWLKPIACGSILMWWKMSNLKPIRRNKPFPWMGRSMACESLMKYSYNKEAHHSNYMTLVTLICYLFIWWIIIEQSGFHNCRFPFCAINQLRNEHSIIFMFCITIKIIHYVKTY